MGFSTSLYDVPVTEGLFTVEVDPGAGVFTGPPRWLEIRTINAMLGGNPVILAPRQSLTPTPYSIWAGSAEAVPPGAISTEMLASSAITADKIAPGAVSQLGTPDGLVPGAVQVTNDRRMGIDTASPAATLHVGGGVPVLLPEVLFVARDGDPSYSRLGGPSAVASSGSLLAVNSVNENAATLVNLSNPSAPDAVGRTANGVGGFSDLSSPVDLALEGSLLAVAAQGSHAVTLATVSDPAVPVLRAVLKNGVGGFDYLFNPRSVVLGGNLLAVAAGSAVTLVDVSNPSSPVLRSVLRNGFDGYNDLAEPRDLALSGGLLAVASKPDDAVTLVNVSNPSSPQLLATMRDGDPGFRNLNGAEVVLISGSTLFIAAGVDRAITLVDISSPANPSPIATIDLTPLVGPEVAGVSGLAVSGNLLAVSLPFLNTVALNDFGDPAKPVLKGQWRNGFHEVNTLHEPVGMLFLGSDLVVAGYRSDAFSILRPVERPASMAVDHFVGMGTTAPMGPPCMLCETSW